MDKKENKVNYEPDYEQKCDNCGQSPVVTIVENGVVIHNYE